MSEPPPVATHPVAAQATSLLAGPNAPQALASALRLLAKWRAGQLARAVLKRDGSKVQSGPFRGMDYGVPPAEGCHVPRLLGCYEASLAPVIEQVIASGYAQILNIGSAEGYYAVGLARRMPGTKVRAHDTNAAAQSACARLAAMNGVAERVSQHGEFTHADFTTCATASTLVLCDIEGGEEALLDPALAPDLRSADILVECHEGPLPGVTDRIAARFAESHRVTRIARQLEPAALPGWMEELGDLDRLLALWEWRARPTPWLWMRRA